jgi:hypothetical protein
MALKLDPLPPDAIADTVEIPLDGRTFVAPSPTERDRLKMKALFDYAMTAYTGKEPTGEQELILTELDQSDPISIPRLALGPAYFEMLDADVNAKKIDHAGMVALLYWVRGAQAARTYWSRTLADRLPDDAPSPRRSPRRPQDRKQAKAGKR